MKKTKLNKEKTKKKHFLNRQSRRILCAILLIILFPLVIGLIYALPFPQIVNVDSGDLLTFYGTSLGIVSSFILYRLEKRDDNKKEREKRLREIKPRICLSVEKSDDTTKPFKINLKNIGKAIFSHIYIEGIYTGHDSINKFETISRNVELPETELKDGLPKEITINCIDIDNNCWCFIFILIDDAGKKYYTLCECEIV